MNISAKLNGISVIFSTLIVLMFLTTIYATNKMRNDGLIINLAGRQRMLTQRMTKEIYQFLTVSKEGKQVERVAANARNTMKVFSMTLSALKDSGSAPLSLNLGETDYRNCPAATEPALGQLMIVENIWSKFSAAMESVLSGQDAETGIKFINSENETLLKEMNKAVEMMQTKSEERVQHLLFQHTFLIVLGIIITLTASIIIHYILKSLKKVIGTMGELENGNMKQLRGMLEVYK